MNKNLFKIDESEKTRILEMHQSATSRHYLGEQVASATTTPVTTTTPKPTDIPGFVWAEDDVNWVKTNGITDDVKVSTENYRRFLEYYNSGDIVGKFVVVFNNVGNNYPYLQANFKLKFVVSKTSVGKSNVQGGNITYLKSGEDLNTQYVTVFANGAVKYCQNNTKCYDLPSPVILKTKA